MSVNSTSPATLFGGTWKAISQGRTLVGVGTWNDINGHKMTWTAETTGGEYLHTLTTNEMPLHTLTTNEMPSHSHETFDWSGNLTQTNQIAGPCVVKMSDPGRAQSYSASGGKAHNNIQPFFVVYMWKRTE